MPTRSMSISNYSLDEPTPVERIRTLDYRLVAGMSITRDDSQYVVEIQSQTPEGLPSSTYRLRLENHEVLDAFGRMSTETRHALDGGEPRRCAYSHGAGEWFVTADAPSAPPAPALVEHGLPESIWEALPQEAKDRIGVLSDQTRNARVRARTAERQTTRLQNQIDEERQSTIIMRRARDTAIAAQAEAEQKANRLDGRNDTLRRMLGSTNVLRTTAVVWRDATKGSAAKLRAFKEFCTALDSLPPEQDLDADFPLAG